jgi:hypothetical protein
MKTEYTEQSILTILMLLYLYIQSPVYTYVVLQLVRLIRVLIWKGAGHGEDAKYKVPLHALGNYCSGLWPVADSVQRYASMIMLLIFTTPVRQLEPEWVAQPVKCRANTQSVAMKGWSYTSTPPMGLCRASVPVQGCTLPFFYQLSVLGRGMCISSACLQIMRPTQLLSNAHLEFSDWYLKKVEGTEFV